MNESVEQKIDRILYYLESDPKTKRKGLVEQQEINTQDISIMKTNEKIKAGKVSLLSFIFGIVGAVALRLLGLFKLFI